MVTFTVDKYGRPGMPTFNFRKVRRLLKSGRADIFCHEPFTIRLLYAEKLDTQPVELCIDAGDRHIGISVKSEKHEFVHAQYDPLRDEKEKQTDRRMHRRTSRSRRRHRKSRFDNRKKPEGWLAPTVEHKKDLHISITQMYIRVCPVTSITVETASFDTQALEAIERGLPLPKGKDYQKGPRYRMNTLRDAVFYRDGHRCRLCGNNGVLRVHHIGYWKGDRSNRMGNLAAVCTGCNTPANHRKGGRLYGWEPEIKPLKGAAFINAVRKRLAEELRERTSLPVTETNGSATKTARKRFCIDKTHANDAFVMGKFHPRHRRQEQVWQKRRRNNRILSKFYDARYVDIRDGKVKSGQELSCGRLKRSESRNSEKNMRPFRGRKVRKGRVSTRRRRYAIRPGTIVVYDGQKQSVKGIHCGGTRAVLENGKSVSVKKIRGLRFPGAWMRIS